MAAKRKPGSRRGRSVIDWNKAFLFFASLTPELRDYQTVANEFGLSVRTVERHGREERWRERARKLDREGAQLAAEQIRDARAKDVVDLKKLNDASKAAYAMQLRDGTLKFNPNHLPKFLSMDERLWALEDEQTAEELAEQPQHAHAADSYEHKLAVMRALNEAGALDDLLRSENHRTNAGDGSAA